MSKYINVLTEGDNHFPIAGFIRNFSFGGNGDKSNTYFKLLSINITQAWQVENMLLQLSITNTNYAAYLLYLHIDASNNPSLNPRGLVLNAINLNKTTYLTLDDIYLIKTKQNETEQVYELWIHRRYTWMSANLSIITYFGSNMVIEKTITNTDDLKTELPTSLLTIHPTLQLQQ